LQKRSIKETIFCEKTYNFIDPTDRSHPIVRQEGKRLQSMVWLRLVGSIKVQVSFAKEPYKKDDILQKRPVISSILLIVATPYPAASSPASSPRISQRNAFSVCVGRASCHELYVWVARRVTNCMCGSRVVSRTVCVGCASCHELYVWVARRVTNCMCGSRVVSRTVCVGRASRHELYVCVARRVTH